MALTVTIGGVAKFIKLGSLHLSQVANGRGTAAFAIRSLDASYRPALDAEVILTEDGTRIFGGLVDIPRERGAADESGVGIITDISAVDFNAYADRRVTSFAIQPGNLLNALQTLMPFLTPSYGITLDPGQVAGPSLPLLGYTLKTVTEVLNDLAALTADAGEPFTWNIDAFRVLSMYQPSTVAAPFNVVGTSLPIPEVVGDIIVESKRGSTYANRFIVYMPPVTQMNRVETFTGDGATTVFTLQYIPFANRGYVVTDYPTNYFETLGGPGDGATWTYDPTNNTLTRTSPPFAGADIRFTFDGTFSALAAAEDSAEILAIGLWERFVVVDAIASDTTVQLMADALLARAVHVGKTVKYRTMEPGVLPGQTQTINVPRRNVNATGVISDVVVRDIGKEVLIRDVTVVVDDSRTNLGRGFRDVYKRWNILGMGGGSATAPSTTTTPPPTTQVGPGGPHTAVQYNNNGVFGGEGEFTYNPATNSIACGGGGTSIDAADAESCQAFGYDTHIG